MALISQQLLDIKNKLSQYDIVAYNPLFRIITEYSNHLGLKFLFFNFNDYDAVFLQAIENNDLPLINCTWSTSKNVSLETAIIIAIKTGNINVVKWMNCQDTSINWIKTNSLKALRTAVEYGHIDIVKWIFWVHNDNDAHHDWEALLREALSNGNYNIVQFFCDNCKKIDQNIFYFVIKVIAVAKITDCNKLLQHLCQRYFKKYNGCDINDIMVMATNSGNIEIVKWLFKNYQLDTFYVENAIEIAQMNADIKMYNLLKWYGGNLCYKIMSFFHTYELQ